MSLAMHEISEWHHRILNPITDDKLMLVGQVSRIGPGTTILDLACGKGELLCRFAQELGSSGHGVDISEVFLPHARARAEELGVADRVTFEQGDAGAYVAAAHAYDVVSCIGATWIADGLTGTLELMRRALRPGGLLLVGEPYWAEPPPAEAYEVLGFAADEFTSLVGTLDRIESLGMDLVEIVLADGDSWDRYYAAQWWTTREWLDANPDDPRASDVRAFRAASRRGYLAYSRRYLGWGVFVIKPALPSGAGLSVATG